MSEKKQIGVFVDWFVPGYKGGGPIRSVANLIEHLNKEFDFHVITSDRDLGMDNPYPDIEADIWLNRGTYRIIYLSPANQSFGKIKKLLSSNVFDLIYLNSLFSVPFSLSPLWASRKRGNSIIMAPRGMLGAGALSIKPVKKKLFLWVFKLLGLHKRVLWQATAVSEQEDLYRVFGKEINILLASNLSDTIKLSWQPKVKHKGSLSVFFLSRISPKKNLLEAIRIMALTTAECQFDFNIIGPVEDQQYWNRCQMELRNMPPHVKVKLIGEVPHQELGEHLDQQHILLLPTLNENYGHVIVESWKNGCPVVISDQTPWQGLENKLIGKVFPLSEKANFVLALNDFAQMNEIAFKSWSKASYQYALSISNDPVALDQNRKLLSN